MAEFSIFEKADEMRIFHITFFTLAVLAVLPHSLATEDTMTSAETLKHEVIAHMDRYIRLANKADASSIAKEIYETPVLMKGFDDLTHDVTLTADELRKQFTNHFNHLKDIGWSHFVVNGYEVTVSGQQIAFVKMQFQWMKKDGSLIGPKDRTACYLLIKKTDGWKTVSVMGN